MGVVLERENNLFLLKKKKKILNCLEKKSNDYSLEGQYPLVEE